ncbi:hypothetical protein LENED_006434 [Lentinula edodes]|uniref:Uncharacterized protein n=1 Tax=Lentinula edodes TaxID=5353 RepID=A0A1Q3EBW7_LENED|nr:hypothetical protein LENED_006434 [Lentinula edodes]
MKFDGWLLIRSPSRKREELNFVMETNVIKYVTAEAEDCLELWMLSFMLVIFVISGESQVNNVTGTPT